MQKRLLFAVTAALALTAFNASAQSTASNVCGTYEGDGHRLEFRGEGRVLAKRSEYDSELSEYRIDGDQLLVRVLESGYIERFKVSADAKTLTTRDATRKPLRRTQAGTGCNEPQKTAIFEPVTYEPSEEAAFCSKGDAFACMSLKDQLLTYQEYCKQGITMGCSKAYKMRAEPADVKGDKDVIVAAVEALGSMYGPPPKVPVTVMMQRVKDCERLESGKFCKETADILWDNGLLVDSARLIESGCDRGMGAAFCETHGKLSGLPLVNLSGAAGFKEMPCGIAFSQTEEGGELGFADEGIVTNFLRMQGRVENGAILVRHDKGGDFIYRPMGKDHFVGQDAWTRYQVFTLPRDGETCTPPVKYREVPFVMDYEGDPNNAESACKNGSDHACVTAGNIGFLSGDVAMAVRNQSVACGRGARVACENLASIHRKSLYDNLENSLTSGKDVPLAASPAYDALQSICAKDQRNLACGVVKILPNGTDEDDE